MGASGLWTVTSVPTTPSWLMTCEAMVSARVSMRSTAVPVRTAMASSVSTHMTMSALKRWLRSRSKS